jgi:hypothetical protein
MKRLFLLPPLLVLFLVAVPSTAAETRVTVDYVIGMLQAGLEQDAIIEQIVDKQVHFVLGEGDLERLRQAGAHEGLVAVVEREVAATGSDAAAGQPGESWSRPQRIPGTVDEGADTAEAAPRPYYGYGYVYYGPWYDYYPYPYYSYYPGYYGVFSYPYYGYYYPYYGHHAHHHGGYYGHGPRSHYPGHGGVTRGPRGSTHRSSPSGRSGRSGSSNRGSRTPRGSR